LPTPEIGSGMNVSSFRILAAAREDMGDATVDVSVADVGGGDSADELVAAGDGAFVGAGEHDIEIIKEFADRGKSGLSTENRHAFTEMLHDYVESRICHDGCA